jgi:predicted TIM-barrel fold metal-dependent hydrolase
MRRSPATSSRGTRTSCFFGSDCTDVEGRGAACHGAQTIGAIRRLSVDKNIERKLLHDNARKLLRL